MKQLKKIFNKKLKYAVIGLFALFFISSGSIWLGGLSSSNPTTARSITAVKQKTDTANVAGAQTQLTSHIPTQEPSQTPDAREQATFLRVIDGDTIEVSLDGKNESVRIIGINTPEVVDPRKPIECLGQEASRHAGLYFEDTDKKLWLEADPTQDDRDKYQRLLRYVFTDEGSVDYGKVMIALGYANEYTYRTPHKYQEVYKQTEEEAREAKKGLWADDACINYTTTNTSGSINTSGSNKSTGGDKDCSDFASHEEAQAYFISKGGSPSNNVDRLDRNRDGIACEG